MDHQHHCHHKQDMPAAMTVNQTHHHMSHDHHHHGGHHSMNMMMMMYFHSSFGHDYILFDFWKPETFSGLLWSSLFLVLFGISVEALKFYRKVLLKPNLATTYLVSENGKVISSEVKKISDKILSWPHLIQTLLHVFELCLSYAVMLIVMTYNVWYFAAIVTGSAIGYFWFGWYRAADEDIGQHCH